MKTRTFKVCWDIACLLGILGSLLGALMHLEYLAGIIIIVALRGAVYIFAPQPIPEDRRCPDPFTH